MEERAIHWSSFHDAVLVSLTATWRSGDVRIHLQLCEQPSRHVVVVGREVSLLHCPREHPWGESVHVNLIDPPAPTPAGRLRLNIEMQTGDRIEVEAASFMIANE